MKDGVFYAGTTLLGLIVLGLLFSEAINFTGNWFVSQLLALLVLGFLALISVIAMGKKSESAPIPSLLFFAVSGINGIYLLTYIANIVVYAIIVVSILGLLFVVSNATIYKRQRVEIVPIQPQKTVAPKKKIAKRVAKKTVRKKPKKKVVKKKVVKKSKKKTAKRKVAKKVSLRRMSFYDVKSKRKFNSNTYVLRKRNDRFFFVAKVPRAKHASWRLVSERQAKAYRKAKR